MKYTFNIACRTYDFQFHNLMPFDTKKKLIYDNLNTSVLSLWTLSVSNRQ